jgi:pectinesterase
MRLARILLFLGVGTAASAPGSVVVPLPVTPDLVVAADGTGDFKSIHEAVQSIARENREPRIIIVKDGVYVEQVHVDAPFITLRGESRARTRLEFSPANSERMPARGRAVLNLSATAHDFVLEHFTVVNTHGQPDTHAFAISGHADQTVLLDSNVFSHANDTLSLWRGRALNPAGTEPPSPGGGPAVRPEGGRYYLARLHLRGSVDFIRPRGWCFIRDSTLTQVIPATTAAIWHDGSNHAGRKFVLRNCRFDGPPDWILARSHHDARLYLVDCTFSPAMRDQAPFRSSYPLDGGEFPWPRDNLEQAPGAPRTSQITAAWTFAHRWDPERTDAPRILELRHQAQPDRLVATFSEAVTVRGSPTLVFPNGDRAELLDGSGTSVLEFSSPNAAFSGTEPTLELNGGAIFSTEAGDRIRLAALTIP